MRVIIMLEALRLEDALLVLETVGFVQDTAFGKEGILRRDDDRERLRVAGHIPEKNLGEIALVGGVLDWWLEPNRDDSSDFASTYPWEQKPETD